ncbi:hypothetical protein [Neoactinobaculum massilliense]|uniref:hypothetical protein n=1 Tax=Neoactinobaculum massilliense TaxID=2364794 RepID=UPI000F52942E|nr:hypothetical protein [Neoactinobaculum massilliense]
MGREHGQNRQQGTSDVNNFGEKDMPGRQKPAANDDEQRWEQREPELQDQASAQDVATAAPLPAAATPTGTIAPRSTPASPAPGVSATGQTALPTYGQPGNGQPMGGQPAGAHTGQVPAAQPDAGAQSMGARPDSQPASGQPPVTLPPVTQPADVSAPAGSKHPAWWPADVPYPDPVPTSQTEREAIVAVAMEHLKAQKKAEEEAQKREDTAKSDSNTSAPGVFGGCLMEIALVGIIGIVMAIIVHFML